MKHMQLIGSGIDTTPILLELSRHSDLWGEITFRQDFPGSPHHDTQTICLRMTQEFSDDVSAEDMVGANTLEAVDFPAYEKIPSAHPLVMWLMAKVNGERLGRVMIVKLAAGGSIEPHIDEGEYPKYYDRFHVVLDSSDRGCIFQVDDETARMRKGEVYWFQNLLPHEAFNDSNVDRIHMIIDIKLRGEKPCPLPTK